jgi:hypothetical protein
VAHTQRRFEVIIMEYVLVALMMTADTTEAVYSFETMAEYRTMSECERSLDRAVKNGTTRLVSLVCAKKDFN